MDDENIKEMKIGFRWFEKWQAAAETFACTMKMNSKDTRRLFLSSETWYNIRIMYYGFMKLLEEYFDVRDE